jgi:hypothetical protein
VAVTACASSMLVQKARILLFQLEFSVSLMVVVSISLLTENARPGNMLELRLIPLLPLIHKFIQETQHGRLQLILLPAVKISIISMCQW